MESEGQAGKNKTQSKNFPSYKTIFRKSSTDLAIALSLGFLLLGIFAESRSKDTQVFLAVINLKQQKYVSLETV